MIKCPTALFPCALSFSFLPPCPQPIWWASRWCCSSASACPRCVCVGPHLRSAPPTVAGSTLSNLLLQLLCKPTPSSSQRPHTSDPTEQPPAPQLPPLTRKSRRPAWTARPPYPTLSLQHVTHTRPAPQPKPTHPYKPLHTRALPHTPQAAGVAISGSVLAVYTASGGLYSVALTDIPQVREGGEGRGAGRRAGRRSGRRHRERVERLREVPHPGVSGVDWPNCVW